MESIQDFMAVDFMAKHKNHKFQEIVKALLIEIEKYVPIIKIRCLYKSYNETTIHYYLSVPDDNIYKNAHYFHDTLPDSLRNEIFLTDVERYFYINDLPNDNTEFSRKVLLMYPEIRSVLQFPFFTTSKHFFFLTFSSYQANVFNFENINKFLETTKLLRDIFAQQYFDSDNFYENILNSDTMLGMCPDLASINQNISKIAPRSTTVLILGETGVGKGVVAKAIHENSKYSYGPFVKVNCGAIPESLLEAELFGYEKGAFTGASNGKPGFFEQANNGTIFLDEIGDFPLSAQTRLLHILEDQELKRVGGVKTIKLNIRIIAATRHDLEKLMEEGKFRIDLWYRLNIFPIYIAPLRERKRDIAVLAKYFVKTKCNNENVEPISIKKESLIKLCQKPWLGNVRELEHYIERGLITYDFKAPDGLDFEANLSTEEVLSEMLDPLFTIENLPTLDQINAAFLRCALKKFDWQVKGEKGAAKALSINPSTLKFKMKQLGIHKPS